ncbi:A disintegrin and metalloproteinase with thrombospondin motifs 16-like [Aricia agestis]|uniref:A disintegrin and metalloproteinase with thrombospondin motifs 16-like n=1 Tax=Aricia agestis TaxID=91739 RepID=UPI001C20B770|nr:A disintegrin and metalloproteinase with thrombospondin motifs 16-like [Aricia agestis]
MRYSFVLLLCSALSCDGYVHSWSRSTPSLAYRTKEKEIVIRTVVHVDTAAAKKMVAQYRTQSRRKIKNAIAGVLENARSLLSHSSLNQTFKFRVLGIKFMRKNNMMSEDATKYLASYCDWQSKRKKQMYYSILLTGLDVYYLNRAGEKNRRSTGRGYQSGMCSMNKSCTLLEWDRKTIAFLLAHEMAHSLGVSHDGVRNRCIDQKHIMATKYDQNRPPRTWSTCSRQYIQQYLQSRKSWCIK